MWKPKEASIEEFLQKVLKDPLEVFLKEIQEHFFEKPMISVLKEVSNGIRGLDESASGKKKNKNKDIKTNEEIRGKL